MFTLLAAAAFLTGTAMISTVLDGEERSDPIVAGRHCRPAQEQISDVHTRKRVPISTFTEADFEESDGAYSPKSFAA